MIVVVNAVIPAMMTENQVANQNHLVKLKHQNQVMQQRQLSHNPLEQLVTNQLLNHNQLELQLHNHPKDQNQVSSESQ